MKSLCSKKFYKVNTEQGLAFADDEGDYYYLFLYVNMSVSFTFPSLEKDILIENVYYEGRKNKKQEIFESFLLDSKKQLLLKIVIQKKKNDLPLFSF